MNRALAPCPLPANRTTPADACLYLGADLAMARGTAHHPAAGIPGQVHTGRRMLTREEKVARIMAQQEAAGLRDRARPVLKSREALQADSAGLLQPMFSALARIARTAQAVVAALQPRFPGASAAEEMATAGLGLGPLDDGATVKDFSESAQVLGLQVQVSQNFLPSGPEQHPATFDPDMARLNGLPLFIGKAAGSNATLALIASYARPGDFIVTTDPHIGHDLACLKLVEAGRCIVSGYCDKQVRQATGVHKNGTTRTFILLSPAEIESLMSVIGPGNRNATFDFAWAGTSPLPAPPFSNTLHCDLPASPPDALSEVERWAIAITAAVTGAACICCSVYQINKERDEAAIQAAERYWRL